MSNSQDDDAVRYPAVGLFTHILTKGLQAGAVLGSGLLIPAFYVYGKDGAKDRTMKWMSYSAAGGLTLAGTLGLVKFMGMDREGLEDRALRIKYNDAQNRLDKMNTVFGIFGAGSMGLMFGPDLYSIITGFSFGTLAAILSHTFTSDHKTDVGKIVHELKY